MAALLASETIWKLGKVIPTNKFALETWVADSSRNIALSGLGVAFLAAQIMKLEGKCMAMRSRIEIKRAQRERKAVTRRKGAGRESRAPKR
jgi:hypothetical protein